MPLNEIRGVEVTLPPLTDAQKHAVFAADGPILADSVPGSGKTRTITCRLATLAKLYNPESILAITFTKGAAAEMSVRAKAMIKTSGCLPKVTHFHSFVYHLLKDLWGVKQLPIAEPECIVGKIGGFYRELTGSDRADSKTMENYGQLISRAKSSGLSRLRDCDEILTKFNQWSTESDLVLNLWKRLDGWYEENSLLDFDDLLNRAVEEINRSEEWRNRLHNQYRHILVDEFQDTNPPQWALVRGIVENRIIPIREAGVSVCRSDFDWTNRSLLACGDGDQCVIAGTLIHTENGLLPAEKIRVGDKLLAGCGVGNTKFSLVTDVMKRFVSDNPIVTVKTKGGYSVTTTPEHIHFAEYTLQGENEMFFTYLMYKQNVGFRIGVTRRYRSRGMQGNSTTLGYKIRTNTENADAVWVLETSETESEARYWEQYYASHYGIPTVCFKSHKGLALTANHIERLYKAVDTEARGKKLLADKHMLLDFPHHTPKCSTSKRRRNFSVMMCKQATGSGAIHECEVTGSSNEDREKLIDAGFNIKNGKNDSWRLRLGSIDLGKIKEFYEKVNQTLGGVNLIRTAGLLSGAFLDLTPASHVRRGMMMYVWNGSEIVLDEVVEIENSTYTGMIYDFNVERQHNFVANGILTHNSIYGFRSADISNILNFTNVYENCLVVELKTNYRSSSTIADCANRLIGHNRQRRVKCIEPHRADGAKVALVGFTTEEEQTKRVAQLLLELYDGRRRIAVLSRHHETLSLVREACEIIGVPTATTGGVPFLETRQIQMVKRWVIAACDLHDTNSLLASLAEAGENEIWRTRAANSSKFRLSLWEYIWQIDGLSEEETEFFQFLLRLNQLIGLSHFSAALELCFNRIEIFTELCEASDPIRMGRLLDAVRMIKGAELLQMLPEADRADFLNLFQIGKNARETTSVSLSTIHASKGFEFDAVIIVGVNDGVMPQFEAEDEEEERRLFYVAVTRAADRLVLCFNENNPSRFLAEITVTGENDFIRLNES